MIYWAGSISLAAETTTNSYAEYLGLIWGLHAATKFKLNRLHVIGDSAMILNQIRRNKPPRSEKLHLLYARARLLADTVGVLTCDHHYRQHNKMTNHLASQAMNKTSAQDPFPMSHPQLVEVAQYLTNDIRF